MSKNEKIKAMLNEKENIKKIQKAHGCEKAPTVVYDGIVDEKTFDAQKTKLLYLLKEVNGNMSSGDSIDYENEDKDFIDITRERAEKQAKESEKAEPKHWKPLCYWTEAFKKTDTSFQGAKNCGGNLLKIAIVNIKKTPGKGTAEDDGLLDAVSGYGEITQEEIRIIAPDLVVCGGTYSYAKFIYEKDGGHVQEETLDCGAKSFVIEDDEGKKIRFVEFVHPGVRAPLAATYAYAKELAKELGFGAERVL